MNESASILGRFERLLVRRTLGLWLVIRAAVAPFAAASGGSPFFIAPSAALMVLGVSVALCWIVTRRRFEDLLLANLGTAPWAIGLLMVVPSLTLEAAIALLGTW